MVFTEDSRYLITGGKDYALTKWAIKSPGNKNGSTKNELIVYEPNFIATKPHAHPDTDCEKFREQTLVNGIYGLAMVGDFLISAGNISAKIWSPDFQELERAQNQSKNLIYIFKF